MKKLLTLLALLACSLSAKPAPWSLKDNGLDIVWKPQISASTCAPVPIDSNLSACVVHSQTIGWFAVIDLDGVLTVALFRPADSR